jgi:hypothetical protein
MNTPGQFITGTVVRSVDQVSTLLEGEVVILNAKTGKYYSLNPVGSRIWELIERPVTFAAIVDAVTTEYEVDRGRCAADVDRILQAMLASGLIELNQEEGGASVDTN